MLKFIATLVYWTGAITFWSIIAWGLASCTYFAYAESPALFIAAWVCVGFAVLWMWAGSFLNKL